MSPSRMWNTCTGCRKLARLTGCGERAIGTLLELSAKFEQDLVRALGTEKIAQLRARLEDVARALESGQSVKP
jgi:hypothetical protein